MGVGVQGECQRVPGTTEEAVLEGVARVHALLGLVLEQPLQEVAKVRILARQSVGERTHLVDVARAVLDPLTRQLRPTQLRPLEELLRLSATLDYEEGKTEVREAGGGKPAEERGGRSVLGVGGHSLGNGSEDTLHHRQVLHVIVRDEQGVA